MREVSKHCTALRSAVACLCLVLPALAADRVSLRQMSEDFQGLATKVSPAVVKILVTGYGPVDENGPQDAALIGRQRSIGSGVILDPNGYVVTNAHVVAGAERVRVVLEPASGGERPAARSRTLEARIAGVDKTTDLAVLKVAATGLPTLPIADYRKVRQGQIVFAFGSPQGLEDSVTMGVVSSVMRQPDPDRPMIYIQTDAAVNPGNSGGPLVDVDGNLVGINSFILSESGGNEGLGFAIPSVIVNFVYREIVTHGHVHRPEIGADVQTISPALAKGLALPRDWGVVVADVWPDGGAAAAGLRIQDVVVGVDGSEVENLPQFQAALYRRTHDSPVALDVIRGSGKLTLKVPVKEEKQGDFDDLAALVKPEKSLVPALGIMGIELTPKIADMLPDLRVNSGVLVVAKAAGAAYQTDLSSGDVIHAVNGAQVVTLESLRSMLRRLKPGDAVAIQYEREGSLGYIAFEIE